MSDGSDAWIAAVHVDVGTAALENKIDPKVKVERDGCLPNHDSGCPPSGGHWPHEAAAS